MLLREGPGISDKGITRRSKVVMLLLLACGAPVSLMTTIWKKWSK